ncbi:MAG: RNA polymerase sigma factor [Deltaproteobacteria bacterium]|nr:RNA polymerase sigma factor [Deltaproteobacteria bacterium]
MELQEVGDLYDKYAHIIYARCLGLLGDRVDAEEALQEVFLRALKSRKGFRRDSSPMTWLTRIATNHCLNVLRSRKRKSYDRHVSLEKLEDGEAKTLDSHLLGLPFGSCMENAATVRKVLSLFPRKTQEIAVYYFVDGMSQAEVALMAGVSLPTLRKRLNDFIETARSHVESYSPNGVQGELE